MDLDDDMLFIGICQLNLKMFSLLRNQNFVRTFVADMISYVNYQET